MSSHSNAVDSLCVVYIVYVLSFTVFVKVEFTP